MIIHAAAQTFRLYPMGAVRRDLFLKNIPPSVLFPLDLPSGGSFFGLILGYQLCFALGIPCWGDLCI